MRRLLGEDPLLVRHQGRARVLVVLVVVLLVLRARATMGAGRRPLLVALAGLVVPSVTRSRGVALPVVAHAASRPATTMGTAPVRAVGPAVQELHVFAKVGT